MATQEAAHLSQTPQEMVDELLALGAGTADALAEELTRRGEAMLTLAQALMQKAMALRSGNAFVLRATMEAASTERSVGKFGAIDMSQAVRVARNLGTFTRRQFAEASGLTIPGASKWVARLVEADPPYAQRLGDSLEYGFIEPPADPPRAHVEAPELAFIGTDAPVQRGKPVTNARGRYPKTSSKDVNGLLKKAHAAGWSITRDIGTNHLSVTPTEGPMMGERIGVSATPGVSAFQAVRANFRQAGLEV